MMLELLMAVPLPLEWQTLPPAHWLEGLQNLLMAGAWRTRVGICSVDSGAVLARLYSASRKVAPFGRITAGADADVVVSSPAMSDAAPDLDRLPEGWLKGLSDGNLVLSGRTATLEFNLTARFQNRVSFGEPPLKLVLRATALAVLPEDPPEGQATDSAASSSAWDPGYEQDLKAWFRDGSHFSLLRAHLLHEGERLAASIEAALAGDETSTVSGPEGESNRLTRLLILPELNGLESMLTGFGPASRRALTGIAQEFLRRRPSLPSVFCRQPDGTLMIWRGHDFVEAESTRDN